MEIGDTAHLYRDLYTELENYEKHGVNMLMDLSLIHICDAPADISGGFLCREGHHH